jgi:hypothetical protein
VDPPYCPKLEKQAIAHWAFFLSTHFFERSKKWGNDKKTIYPPSFKFISPIKSGQLKFHFGGLIGW